MHNYTKRKLSHKLDLCTGDALHIKRGKKYSTTHKYLVNTQFIYNYNILCMKSSQADGFNKLEIVKLHFPFISAGGRLAVGEPLGAKTGLVHSAPLVVKG